MDMKMQIFEYFITWNLKVHMSYAAAQQGIGLLVSEQLTLFIVLRPTSTTVSRYLNFYQKTFMVKAGL